MSLLDRLTTRISARNGNGRHRVLRRYPRDMRYFSWEYQEDPPKRILVIPVPKNTTLKLTGDIPPTIMYIHFVKEQNQQVIRRYVMFMGRNNYQTYELSD